jgi:hypothetical protein
MLKKEIIDSLKRLEESTIVFVLFFIAYILDRTVIHTDWEFLVVFNVVFLTTIVLFAVHAGTSIFHCENKDRAFEYLLSLPLSRMKIVLYKILPRFAILILLLGGLMISYGLEPTLRHTGNLIFLFFISVFISIEIISALVGFVGVGLFYLVFQLSTNIMNYFAYKLNIINYFKNNFLGIILSAAFLLIPFGLSFWITFKNFDLKPLKYHIKAYYYIAFPAFAILVVLIVLFYNDYLSFSKNM